MSGTDEITVDRVRRIDAFAGLGDEALERVAAIAQSRSYEADEELLHHEEWPEDLLALEDGEVEVRRDGEVLATLGSGCVVGERGVVRRALRNADVVATSPVKVLFFHLNKVRELRRDMPEIDERLQALADQRDR